MDKEQEEKDFFDLDYEEAIKRFLDDGSMNNGVKEDNMENIKEKILHHPITLEKELKWGQWLGYSELEGKKISLIVFVPSENVKRLGKKLKLVEIKRLDQRTDGVFELIGTYIPAK